MHVDIGATSTGTRTDKQVGNQKGSEVKKSWFETTSRVHRYARIPRVFGRSPNCSGRHKQQPQPRQNQLTIEEISNVNGWTDLYMQWEVGHPSCVRSHLLLLLAVAHGPRKQLPGVSLEVERNEDFVKVHEVRPVRVRFAAKRPRLFWATDGSGGTPSSSSARSRCDSLQEFPSVAGPTAATLCCSQLCIARASAPSMAAFDHLWGWAMPRGLSRVATPFMIPAATSSASMVLGTCCGDSSGCKRSRRRAQNTTQYYHSKQHW